MNFVKRHIKALSGLLALATMGLVTSVFAINWSNTQFIDSAFWAQNPTSGDIVAALFGNANIPVSTAYTQGWSTNACIGANMTVQYVATDSLPQLLAGNTVYVLTGNQAITGEVTFLGPCIALVSSGGQYGLTKGTNAILGINNSMLYTNNAQNIIIDGVSLNGYDATLNASIGFFASGSAVSRITINNISGSQTSSGDIVLSNGVSDIGIYNSVLGNNSTVGVHVMQSSNVHVVNTQIFKATGNGIMIFAGSGITVTHTNIHDNASYNIIATNSSNILLNNSQLFNNLTVGFSSLRLDASTMVSINNTAIYNAASDGNTIINSSGISFYNTLIATNGNDGINLNNSTNIALIDTKIFGNAGYGVYMANSSSIRTYGNISIFSNGSNGPIGVDNLLSTIMTGNNTDLLVNGLGFVPSTIDLTGTTLICALRVLPVAYPYGGITNCLLTGSQAWTLTNTGIYGENLPLQKQALVYASPTQLGYASTIPYNANLHITDSYRFGGRLTATGGANYQGSQRWFTTGTQLSLYNSEAANYVITGDVMVGYNGITNGSTTLNIQWSTGDGLKVLTGYYYTGTKQSQLYRVIRFYDTTAPSIPVNTTPANSGTFVGTAVQLVWNAGVDTGVGTSGYSYVVSTNSGFTAIVQSGWTTTNFVNLSGLAQTIYYRRVQAVDSLGNTSSRSTGTMFQYAFSGFVLSVANNTGLSVNQVNTVSLSLYDVSNNLLTGYQGTVAWSITGINTPPNPPYTGFTIPATSGLVANTNGIYTFASGLTITYPGIYQLTVYDVNNPSISGSIQVTVIGVVPSVLSGSISIIPQYTNGAFTINLATNTSASYVLSGPFAPVNGAINTTVSIPTTFNTTNQGSYPVSVTYATGFYVYTASTTVILDTTAPSVQLTSPVSGSTVSGSIVTIAWTGSEFGTPSFSGYNITVSDGISPIQQTGYQAQSMTLTLADGVRTVTITAIDQAGNSTTTTSTFTVDTTAPTIANPYPSQTMISTTPFNFSWTHVDVGGFNHATITLYDNDGNVIAGPIVSYGTSVSLGSLGISTLPNGLYQWTLTTYDNAGNATNGGPYLFSVLQSIPGQIAGIMDFASLFGTVIQSGSTYYTNTTQLQALLASNMATTVAINGNISPTVVGFNLLSPFHYGVQAIQLTPGEGAKNITALFTAGVLTPFSTVKVVILDTIAPTNLTLLSPANGGTVTGNFVLDWSDALDDSGSGLSGYVYQIDNNSGFSSIDVSGSTINSSITLTTGGLTAGTTYYWRVRAFDHVNNYVTSDTGSFIVNLVVPSSDTTPDSFSLNDVNNANTDETYVSNQITVSGLGSGVQVLASVSRGVLYINNAVVGTTGMVDNGDKVKIEMISSNDAGDEVSSVLTIGNQSDTWKVKTDSNNDNADLSRGERLQLSLIFDMLVETYRDNPSRALAFFQTLENAIQNMLDDGDLSNSEEQSLQYFLDLVQNYIDDEFNGVSTTLIYTAPNNKKYRVAFDEGRNAYYSPDFIKPAYFDSKNSFAAYIDRQNPGSHAGSWSDGNILNGTNGVPNLGNNVIVAPNGKVYRITHTGNIWTSPDFITPKTFASEAELRNYIISHNH